MVWLAVGTEPALTSLAGERAISLSDSERQ